ncbi:MAG: DUF547 domain-containing protein [Bacteroidota bacterium]
MGKAPRINCLLVGALMLLLTRTSVAQAPSHAKWDQLLKKYVGVDGRVNYKGFSGDKNSLNAYLQDLTNHSPDNRWKKNEKLAYWINAYNAFTVKLIVDNYPLKGIKDLNPTVALPGVNTVWQKRFFKIGPKETSLDDIEHEILRKQFDEPRIHFAINCASVSCPVLLNEAYTPDKIEQQLQQQAIRFVNDPTRNIVSKNELRLSQIFNWFTKDFTKKGTLIDFVNQYAKVKVSKNASLKFLEYNWNLNE